LDTFHQEPFPLTEYALDLQESNESPVTKWLRSLTLDNYYNVEGKRVLEMTAAKGLNLYSEWCCVNNITNYLSSIKFGQNLKDLQIDGVGNKRHTKKGNVTIYDIDKLITAFKLHGIEMDEGDEDNEDNDAAPF
jgi:hypothetical protein